MAWDEATRQLERRIANLEAGMEAIREERRIENLEVALEGIREDVRLNRRRIDRLVNGRTPVAKEGEEGGLRQVNWKAVGAFAAAILGSFGGPLAVAYFIAGGGPG